MEILNHNFLPLALNIAVVLSCMCIALIIVMTVVHWRTDKHQKDTIDFDRVNEPFVMSYLDGNTTKASVIKSMEKEPSKAVHLLMKISRNLQPAAQSRLLPLFAGIPEIENEIAALSSPSAKRRLQAAERLAYLKGEISEEALLDALEDEVIAVQYCAARSLAAHGKAEFIEPTLRSFDGEKDINWFRLIEITLNYGPPAVPVLLTVLENQQETYSTNIINVAIRALGNLKEPRAVQPLIHLLDHSDLSIRLNAAHALGDIGDPAAITPIAELSHDPNWEVRNNAVEAIGKLQAETQMPILTEALTDPSWWVRFSAAQSLYSLGQSGIEKLKDIMKSTSNLYTHEMCCQVLSEHDVHDSKHNLS